MKTTAIRIGSTSACGCRFDAGFHLSDGMQARQTLACSPYESVTVGECVSDVFYGGRDKRVYVKDAEHGIPFVGSSTMLKADLSDVKFVSRKYTASVDDMLLKSGWILVSRSGTVGKTVFSNGIHLGMAGSEHIIRIVPNNTLPAGIIYAFLASRFGYALLTQGTFGSVIDTIEPAYVKSIQVPVFPVAFQRKVHEKIVESARLREEADAALKRAVGLFEREAGCGVRGGFIETALPKGRGAVSLGRITDKWRRFDAHYQLGTQFLDAEKAKCPVEQVSLASVAKSMFVGGRGKRNYVKNGIPFLSSSDMMLFNAIRESKPISRSNPGLSSLLVHENDILISRSGTVGNVIIVGHDLDKCAVSEHALRLVVDETKISPLYVFCYLKTAEAKAYMEASAYGSVIITINETFVGAIRMPVFKGKIYDSIVRDIGEYKAKLATAADLENTAIDMVEREIESWQGGGR